MKFKVCGLFDKENIFNVIQLNPDYIGHIFWEKSVRYVKGDTPQIDNSKKTGVFYNSNYDFISEKIENHKLKCVQLHGDESPNLCKKFLDLNIEVIKSFRIDQNFDFDILNKYMDCCNLFLFDSKSELPGGTGKTFNWELLKRYKLKICSEWWFGSDMIDLNRSLLVSFGKNKSSNFSKKFKEIIDNEI